MLLSIRPGAYGGLGWGGRSRWSWAVGDLGAKAAGARQVIGIDPVAYKRDGAKQLGADQVFDSNDPHVIEKVKDASGGGLEYVFEAVGEVEAIELAYAVTGRGGTTTSSGLSHPSKNFR